MKWIKLVEKLRQIRAIGIFIGGWGMAYYSQTATWHRGSWLMLISLVIVIGTAVLEGIFDEEDEGDDIF